MVIVAGTAIAKFGRRKDQGSYRDWISDTVRDALADAALEPQDIDALVVASESDLFSLQLNPAAAIASDLGLVGASAIRVEGGGASGQLAIHTAAQAILAGTARRIVVMGFENGASQLGAPEVSRLYGYSFDGPAEAALGIRAVELYALSVQCWMAESGATPHDLAGVAVKNHGNALGNPLAHLPMSLSVTDVLASPLIASPYHRLECSPVSDAVAVAVLTSADEAPQSRRSAARIVGIGTATDYSRLGDRSSPATFRGKTEAAKRAMAMSGIDDPTLIGVAEVYDAFAGAELQSIEALGLAGDSRSAFLARDGVFGRSGRLPINLSGGLLGQGAAPGATGIAQVATLARVLTGRYWQELQPASILRYGLADSHGGIATLCAVTVMEAPR
jgi:acetyl-CoA C-acetyltransferase